MENFKSLELIDYKQCVREPIDLAKARALATQIIAQDQIGKGPSWFGALARCVVTLCDEFEAEKRLASRT